MQKQISEDSRIIYYCYSQMNRDGENYIGEHTLSYLIAGTQEVYLNDEKYIFHEGDIRFFSRAQLARFVKIPSAEGKFAVVTVHLDRDTLRDMSAVQMLKANVRYEGEPVVKITSNTLLTNYFKSLEPYYDHSGQASEGLTNLKIREAVMILLESNPALQNLLFDFREPGKIDLRTFMLKNFRYNVNVERFAYLTGRSLSTFKRDFRQTFGLTPHAWLMQQRLQKAHQMLEGKKSTLWEIYQEVGFKDNTHFSYAFKKQYGYPPSTLISGR